MGGSMIEFWAVIGLSTIDHVFYDEIVENLNNADAVVEVLRKYNFRLSRYEVGELIRIYSKLAFRIGIENIQEEGWVHGGGPEDTPCWTGCSISGMDAPLENRVYRHPFVQGKSNGEAEIASAELDHFQEP